MNLVIGSSGFIGQALCKRFTIEGVLFKEMNSNDLGILNYKNFEKFNNVDIRHVYHLGSTTFVPDSWNDPMKFHNVITNGTLNVLKFCEEKKSSLTYVSAYVYGNQIKQPISEDAFKVKSNPYAHAKIIAEKHCEYFRDFFNLKVNIIRPFNIYGIGQKDIFFIPWLVKQAIRNDEVQLENIITKRDFIYLEDLVDSLIASKNFINKGDVYNVGSGKSHSVEDIIKITESLLNKKIKITTNNHLRENEILDTVANIEKIKQDFSWYPKVDIKLGLELIVNNLLNQWRA